MPKPRPYHLSDLHFVHTFLITAITKNTVKLKQSFRLFFIYMKHTTQLGSVAKCEDITKKRLFQCEKSTRNPVIASHESTQANSEHNSVSSTLADIQRISVQVNSRSDWPRHGAHSDIGRWAAPGTKHNHSTCKVPTSCMKILGKLTWSFLVVEIF